MIYASLPIPKGFISAKTLGITSFHRRVSAEATFFQGPSCSQIWSFSPVGPHSLCVSPQRCIWSSGRAVTRVWQVGPYHPPNLIVLLLLLLLLCTGPHHPPDLAPSNCTTTPHPQWRSLPVSLLANKTGRYITMILPKSDVKCFRVMPQKFWLNSPNVYY